MSRLWGCLGSQTGWFREGGVVQHGVGHRWGDVGWGSVVWCWVTSAMGWCRVTGGGVEAGQVTGSVMWVGLGSWVV